MPITEVDAGKVRWAATCAPVAILESIVDSMTEGSLAVDPQGRVLFVNAAAERLARAAGLPAVEVLAGALCEPLSHALAGEVVEERQLVVRGVEPCCAVRLAVSAHPLPDGAGALALFRDITRLHRSEQRYRSMVENVPDVITVIDAGGAIVFQSRSVEKALGYGPEELLGSSAFALIHPEDLAAALEFHRAVLRQPGVPLTTEYRCWHRDGSWRNFESIGRALSDETGTAGVVITSHDLTERARTEEQLLFQASLLDQVSNAVIATDAEARLIYWNRGAEEMHQWKREEVLGRRISELDPPPFEPAHWEQIWKALLQSGRWQGEAVKQRRDGTKFPAAVTVSFVRNRSGEVIGGIGVSSDITARKRAEEQLQASREQMRRLAARLESIRELERSRIAREIHDQLAQNLTALKLELSHLGKKLAFETELLADLQSAAGLVDHTALSVQRIATELRPSILDDLGLGAAIEWQAQEFQSRTGTRCVITRWPGDIAPSKPIATAVFRIFQELLTNVARHAHATLVTVSLTARGGHLMLQVKDNGRGITPEQAAAPTSLGLLGMRERALALGGEIDIRGARGDGTTVRVCVPWRGVRRKSAGRKNPRKG